MITAKRGDRELTDVLLSGDVDPDIRENVSLLTDYTSQDTLRGGCCHYTEYCLVFLHPPSPQRSGWSALFFSAEAGHTATTQSLLRAGANAHLRDKVQCSPLGLDAVYPPTGTS